MLNKLLLAALTALLVPACLDDAAPIETERALPDGSSIERFSNSRNERSLEDKAPLCEQIVETEGACAAACDEEALLAFVPEGTCALFPCTLEDGRIYNVGGCNR